jgi:predicted RNA-binding protein with PIN domain
MIYDWLIIDGYNLLHQCEALVEIAKRDLLSARQGLVRLTESAALQMAHQTTIVFDGREKGIDPSLTSKHLEVYFSPGHLSADSIIERLVCKVPNPERLLVVTSDLAERTTVSGAGAHTMSSREFMERCQQAQKKVIPKQTPPGKEPKLGDLFPPGW